MLRTHTAVYMCKNPTKNNKNLLGFKWQVLMTLKILWSHVLLLFLTIQKRATVLLLNERTITHKKFLSTQQKSYDHKCKATTTEIQPTTIDNNKMNGIPDNAWTQTCVVATYKKKGATKN